jgi:hypothetical protein
MRRAVGLGAVVTAAGLALWRARRGGPREHVDLYFADGSMVSLPETSPDAGRLLGLARDVLAAAR